LYTVPSMVIYSPLSMLLCSATCLVVNDSDMATVDGYGYSRDDVGYGNGVENVGIGELEGRDR
jgi:hypothetical protein